MDTKQALAQAAASWRLRNAGVSTQLRAIAAEMAARSREYADEDLSEYGEYDYKGVGAMLDGYAARLIALTDALAPHTIRTPPAATAIDDTAEPPVPP